MSWLEHVVRGALLSWGYLTVAVGLMSESLGLPLPGETVLTIASFLAHKSAALQIYWIIPVGIGASVIGDNLGYLFGRKFGPALIRWARKIARLDDLDIEAAKDLIRRRGWPTIFIARFIFGLRTIAGPVAGSLGMEWKEFLHANVAGAATWVTTIGMLAYLIAGKFSDLDSYYEKAGWAISVGLFVTGYLIWRRQKKQYRKKHRRQQSEKSAA